LWRVPPENFETSKPFSAISSILGTKLGTEKSVFFAKENVSFQHAKKVVSDSPGLVDFAIGLVIFVLNLPDGQVLFFGEIEITEGL